MGLFMLDMVMVAQRWEGIPHPALYTPETIMHWMEDVTLGDDWMTHDDIHPSAPWTPSFTPWMLGIWLMVSCYGLLRLGHPMMGFVAHLDTP
jgi:hypothetical protein